MQMLLWLIAWAGEYSLTINGLFAQGVILQGRQKKKKKKVTYLVKLQEREKNTLFQMCVSPELQPVTTTSPGCFIFTSLQYSVSTVLVVLYKYKLQPPQAETWCFLSL